MPRTDTVKTVAQHTPKWVHIAAIAGIVAAFALLGLMDSDTGTWTDILHTDNILGLLIYTLPTGFVCRWLYYKWDKSNPVGLRLCMSLAAGIPTTFFIIIIIAMLAKAWHWV
jgi:hypothetical protein